MQYLQLKRSRIIIGAFLVFSLLAISFPQMDLLIYRWFFDGHSFLRDQWWPLSCRGSAPTRSRV